MAIPGTTLAMIMHEVRPIDGEKRGSEASQMIYREFVAWAFWTGKDAILKERLYGLSGSEVMAKTLNSFTIMAMSMKLSPPMEQENLFP